MRFLYLDIRYSKSRPDAHIHVRIDPHASTPAKRCMSSTASLCNLAKRHKEVRWKCLLPGSQVRTQATANLESRLTTATSMESEGGHSAALEHSVGTLSGRLPELMVLPGNAQLFGADEAYRMQAVVPLTRDDISNGVVKDLNNKTQVVTGRSNSFCIFEVWTSRSAIILCDFTKLQSSTVVHAEAEYRLNAAG